VAGEQQNGEAAATVWPGIRGAAGPAVEPRVKLLERVLADLQERGAVRADIDIDTIATRCFGSY
jgi:hypothetical protein